MIIIDLQKAAATWILKVKEKNKLSQMTMQGIIEDVTSLFQTYLRHLYHSVKLYLEENFVADDVIAPLEEMFSSNGKYGEPFRGLKTEYFQSKYFQDHFSMVVCVTKIAVFNIIINNVIDPPNYCFGVRTEDEREWSEAPVC